MFSFMWVGDSHVSNTLINLSGSFLTHTLFFVTLFLHVLDFILSNKNISVPDQG